MIRIQKDKIARAEESVRAAQQTLALSRAWWKDLASRLREASSLPELPELLERIEQALNDERMLYVACEAADFVCRLALDRIHSGQGRYLFALSMEEVSRLLRDRGYFVAAAAFAAAAARIRGGRPTWWAAQLLEEGRVVALLFRLLRFAEKAEKGGRVPDLRDPDWPESTVAARMVAAIRGLAIRHENESKWEYPGWALDPARLQNYLTSFLSKSKPAGKEAQPAPAPTQKPGPESLGARARLKRPAPESNNGVA